MSNTITTFADAATATGELLCEWTNGHGNVQYREWQNAELFRLCNLMGAGEVCLGAIQKNYADEITFTECNFSDYRRGEDDEPAYFTFAINTHDGGSDVYVNSLWFDLRADLLPAPIVLKSHAECDDDIRNFDENTTMLAHPCNTTYDGVSPDDCLHSGDASCATGAKESSAFCCSYASAVNGLSRNSSDAGDGPTRRSVLQRLNMLNNLGFAMLCNTTILLALLLLCLCLSGLIGADKAVFADICMFNLFFVCPLAIACVALTIISVEFAGSNMFQHINDLYYNDCVPGELTALLHIENTFWSLGGIILALNILICVLYICGKVRAASAKAANTTPGADESSLSKFDLINCALALLSYIAMLINFAASTSRSLELYSGIADDMCYTRAVPLDFESASVFNSSRIVPFYVAFVCVATGTVSAVYYLRKHGEQVNWQKSPPDKLLTILTVFMSAASAIGSIALIGALGLDDDLNGLVAMLTAVIACSFAVLRIVISFASSTLERDVLRIRTREQAIAIFMSSLTDSTFDFFQGVAAVLGHAYSDSAFAVLIAATWIGVTDELIECVIEINLGICEETDGCCVSLKFVFLFWSVIEAALGIYLLSTYSSPGLVASGIAAEVAIIIFSLLFIVRFLVRPMNATTSDAGGAQAVQSRAIQMQAMSSSSLRSQSQTEGGGTGTGTAGGLTAGADDEDAEMAQLMRRIREAEERITEKKIISEIKRKKTEENLKLEQQLKALHEEEVRLA